MSEKPPTYVLPNGVKVWESPRCGTRGQWKEDFSVICGRAAGHEDEHSTTVLTGEDEYTTIMWSSDRR